MKGDPKWRDYYSAAIYYRESNRDLQKAKKWMAKAIELDGGKYYMYRQQALILADLNEKEAAIEASKMSLKLAKEVGNEDYVRLNTKAIEEWSK
jgi:tetratricopeptide (TPR) repeat protein